MPRHCRDDGVVDALAMPLAARRRAQKGCVVEAREDSLAKLPLSAAISV
jgi:hypothetical protein